MSARPLHSADPAASGGGTPVTPPAGPRVAPPAAAPYRVVRVWPLALLSVVLVAVAAAGAWGVSSMQPTRWRAEADLLVSLGDVGGDRSGEVLQTQLVLATGAEVIDEIARREGLTARQAGDAVSAELLDGSAVLRLAADAERPAAAERMVATLAERLAAGNDGSPTSGALSELTDDAENLSARLAGVHEELAAVTAERLAGSRPDVRSGAEFALESEAQRLQATLAQLDARRVELEIQRRTTGRTSLVVRPHVLPDPVAPQPMRAAALGALAGGGVAAGLVWLRVRGRPGARS